MGELWFLGIGIELDCEGGVEWNWMERGARRKGKGREGGESRGGGCWFVKVSKVGVIMGQLIG